jgi:predicted membrane channel-forming protein YqfA (hemolysin III family)
VSPHRRGRFSLNSALVVAIVGAAIHDLVEFGRPAPTNTGALLVVGASAAWCARSDIRRIRTIGTAVLVAAAVTFLIGGAVASVLPLPLWPWQPEQTLSHYAIHVLWAVSIVPLLLVSIGEPQAHRRNAPPAEVRADDARSSRP